MLSFLKCAVISVKEKSIDSFASNPKFHCFKNLILLIEKELRIVDIAVMKYCLKSIF